MRLSTSSIYHYLLNQGSTSQRIFHAVLFSVIFAGLIIPAVAAEQLSLEVVPIANGDYPVEGVTTGEKALGGSVCGGIAGLTCPDDGHWYCAGDQTNPCMDDPWYPDIAGTCVGCDPWAVCTLEYNPVCGCDGQTYSNSCQASVQNCVPIRYSGVCSDGGCPYPAPGSTRIIEYDTITHPCSTEAQYIEDATPSFRFYPVETADYYEIQFFSGSCEGTAAISDTLPVWIEGQLVDGFHLTGAFNPGYYCWRMRAVGSGDGAPVYGCWTNCCCFVVGGGCSVLSTPHSPRVNGQNCSGGGPIIVPFEQGITLSWDSVANAQGYDFELYSQPCSGAAEPVYSATVSGTSITVPDHLIQTGYNYYWRCRARGDGSNWCYSDWLSCCPFRRDHSSTACVRDRENGVECLQNGRFELTMTWTDFDSTVRPLLFLGGCSTQAVAKGTIATTPNDILVIAKVTNACSLDNHWWVWFGGFTKAGLTLTVRDTQTDQTEQYVKPVGELMATIKDVQTFSCP